MSPRAAKAKTPAAPAPEPCEVYSREFANVLTDVLLFSDRSGFLPVLDTVLLSVEAGRLVATCTDRYALAQRHMDWTGRPEFEPFLLDGGDAADLVQVLRLASRTSKGRGIPVNLTIGAELRVAVGSLTVCCARKEGEFPKYQKLLDDAEAKKPAADAGRLALNAQFLAKFGRLSVKDPIQIVTTGPSNPVLVRIGEDFRGLLMPVRMASFSNEVAA